MMLDNIIDKNIMFLQRHGVKMDSNSDRAVYKYGLQILYYYIIDLIVVFSLAYMFGRLYETAIMTFVFAILQVFGGGYHAKTPQRCLMTMIVGAITGNILISIFLNFPAFIILSSGVLSAAIFILVPVTNENRPVGKKTYKRSTFIARTIILLVLFALTLLLKNNKNLEAIAIVSTLYLYTISLIAAKLAIIFRKGD